MKSEHYFYPGTIEPFVYSGETEKIIALALDALGLSFFYLIELMELPFDITIDRFKSENLGGDEWIAICDALYLNVSSISTGYSRMEHRARIKEAIESGYFHFSKENHCVRKLMFEIKQRKREDWFFQSEHYGFRLRWKIRTQDYIQSLKRKLRPNPHQYDPLARIREIGNQPMIQVRPGLFSPKGWFIKQQFESGDLRRVGSGVYESTPSPDLLN